MITPIDELKTAAEAAQQALAEALADGHSVPIARARKAAQEAAQAVSDALAVQDLLRQRDQAAEATEKATERAVMVAKARDLIEQRVGIATDIEATARRLGELLAEFKSTTVAIPQTAPGKIDAGALFADWPTVAGVIERRLYLHGAINRSPGLSAWEISRLPDLTGYCRNAVAEFEGRSHG